MVNNSHTPGRQSEASAVGFLRFLWRPSPNQVDLASSAPPEQVLSQLQNALAASEEFAGRVRGNGVQIVRRRAFARVQGGFSPVFYGAVLAADKEEAASSRLTGHFQLHPVTRLFMLVWLGLGAVLALVFLVLGLLRATPESTAIDALPFAAPVLIPVLGAIVLLWQQHRGREDEEAVRRWLVHVMDRGGKGA